MKKNESHIFFKTVQLFLTEFMPRQRNLSRHSVQACRDSLNLLMDYIVNKKNMSLKYISFNLFNDINVITGFLGWLETDRLCCNSTINQRLSCVRSFFKYAAYKDVTFVALYNRMQTIPQRKIKYSKVMEFMSEEAIQTLLACPDTKTKTGLRDCFYMALLYDSAARNSEILALRMGDIIDDSKAPYIIVDGKGNKKRSIPLMPKTMDIYRIYIRKFHDTNYNPVDNLIYVNHNGQKMGMSDDNVAKFIKKYAGKARKTCNEIPENVHPHMFRRTRAMHLYRNGMPLPLLSEFLGHEDPETTLVYAYADTEMKRKAIEKATSNSQSIPEMKAVPVWQDDDEMIRKLYGLK